MIQTRHKKLHATLLHLSTLVWLHMMAKKRKTGDKEADLLCCAVLRGMSCFDSK